jgi:phospholipid-binding lipoprotein MlaA
MFLAFMQRWRERNSGSRLAIVLLAAILVTGCATAPNPKYTAAVADYEILNDPAEPTNRAIFKFNKALDTAIFKPVATVYKDYTPSIFQRGVHNVLNNLRTPIIFANDLLQGKLQRAWNTLARFFINSTIGFAGLGDPAADYGFKFHNEDFGQTLAAWGLPEGPYIVLPVFGPSNPRDAIGLAVDALIDPMNIWLSNTNREELIFARAGVRGIDERARNFDALEDLEKSSLDFYASLRSLYRQHRSDEIRDGKPSVKIPMPGLSNIIPGITPDEEPGSDLGQNAASRTQ